MSTKFIIKVERGDRVFVADAADKVYHEATVLESEQDYISVDATGFSSFIKKIIFNEEGISKYESFTHVDSYKTINKTNRYFIILVSDIIKYNILTNLKNIENCIFENNWRLKGKLLERKKFSFTVDFGDNKIIEYFNNGQCVTNLRDCVTVTEEEDVPKVLNILNGKAYVNEEDLINEYERMRLSVNKNIITVQHDAQNNKKISEKEMKHLNDSMFTEVEDKSTITKMENSKMKDIAAELKVKGIDNAKFVAKITLGKTILEGVNKQIKKKIPMIARGYYEEYHALSDMVIASVLSVAGKNYYGNSKKLNLILESVELAALADGGNKGAELIGNLLSNIQIPEILQAEIDEDEGNAEPGIFEQTKKTSKNK